MHTHIFALGEHEKVCMDKLIVFRKVWEYLVWLRPTVERFARVHKYSLGVEMQANTMSLLRLVIKANYAEIKGTIIAEAIEEHEVQRIFLRLAFEYKLINSRQFGFAASRLDEIGRLLRGWKNKYK